MNRLSVWIAILLFSAGCVFLPLESSVVPHPPSPVSSDWEIPHSDYSGVIHVHSSYSDDGRLSVNALAQIANRQGLDYLYLTELDLRLIEAHILRVIL